MNLNHQQSTLLFVDAVKDLGAGSSAQVLGSWTGSSGHFTEPSCFYQVLSWIQYANQSSTDEDSDTDKSHSTFNICTDLSEHIFQLFALEITRCHLEHQVPLTKPLTFSRLSNSDEIRNVYTLNESLDCSDISELFVSPSHLKSCLSLMTDAEFELYTHFTLMIDSVCSKISYASWEVSVVESSMRTLNSLKAVSIENAIFYDLTKNLISKTIDMEEESRKATSNILSYKIRANMAARQMSYRSGHSIQVSLSSREFLSNAHTILDRVSSCLFNLKGAAEFIIGLFHLAILGFILYTITIHALKLRRKTVIILLSAAIYTLSRFYLQHNSPRFQGGSLFIPILSMWLLLLSSITQKCISDLTTARRNCTIRQDEIEQKFHKVFQVAHDSSTETISSIAYVEMASDGENCINNKMSTPISLPHDQSINKTSAHPIYTRNYYTFESPTSVKDFALSGQVKSSDIKRKRGRFIKTQRGSSSVKRKKFESEENGRLTSKIVKRTKTES